MVIARDPDASMNAMLAVNSFQIERKGHQVYKHSIYMCKDWTLDTEVECHVDNGGSALIQFKCIHKYRYVLI